MRILYIDCDTLRADHLGCYGYQRDTSPNIDWIAHQGVRFTNCYATDAPCLPSRAALFSGRFGIHNGMVGHGGTAADPLVEGAGRRFRQSPDRLPWVYRLREAGLRTVTVSPFADRHSSWWFYEGFAEFYDPGKKGMERAEEVNPLALDWIRRNAAKDNWFLHVHYWDPHTPYRTPLEYGNPFEGEPLPEWYNEEVRAQHYAGYGPHSAHEPLGWGGEALSHPRMPAEIASMDDWRRWIDGYDVGIRYMDDHVGQLLEALDDQGALEDLVILISADHGENQGELNVYGDHQTADEPTSRVPLVIRWPGLARRVDEGLYYQLDLAPTLADLTGAKHSARWDGRSFAQAFRKGDSDGRSHLVVSQCAWSCQRSVRMGRWLMMRTYHDGLKDFPPYMLFDLNADPHQQLNQASGRPDVVSQMSEVLEAWHAEMMASSTTNVDPMWTVIREGGPEHTRHDLERYCRRLRETDRAHHAEALLARHGKR